MLLIIPRSSWLQISFILIIFFPYSSIYLSPAFEISLLCIIGCVYFHQCVLIDPLNMEIMPLFFGDFFLKCFHRWYLLGFLCSLFLEPILSKYWTSWVNFIIYFYWDFHFQIYIFKCINNKKEKRKGKHRNKNQKR